MKSKHLLFGLLGLFFMISGCGNEQGIEASGITPQATIIDFGLYESLLTTPVDGKSSKSGVTHSKSTHSIPLNKGVIFGYRASVTGLPKDVQGTIDIRYSHPEFGANDQSIRVVEGVEMVITSFEGEFIQDVIYHIENEQELIPGHWKLDIVYDAKVLVSQDFYLQ